MQSKFRESSEGEKMGSVELRSVCRNVEEFRKKFHREKEKGSVVTDVRSHESSCFPSSLLVKEFLLCFRERFLFPPPIFPHEDPISRISSQTASIEAVRGVLHPSIHSFI